MTPPLDDDTLLAALGESLAPEPVEPGPEAIAALHRALATRLGTAAEDDADPAVVVPLVPTKRRSGWAGIHRLRHPVAAAVAVGVLATSGVAAAGVATDHLPGPTRNVAYALGLPVTSPALEVAEGTLSQLKVALAGHDVTQVAALAAQLRQQLSALSTADRAQIGAAASDALRQADTFAQSVPTGTAPGGPTSTGGSTGSNGTAPSGGSGESSGGSSPAGPTSSDGTSSSGAGDSSGDSSGGAKPGAPGSTVGEPGGTTSPTGSPTTTDGPPETTPATTPGTKPPATTPTTEPGDKSDDGTDHGDSRVNAPTTGSTTPTTLLPTGL